MSNSWTSKGVLALSESNRQKMVKDVEENTVVGGHDNVNLSFRVFESRKDKQTRFESGTAGTVYPIKDPTIVPPDRKAYLEKRAEGCLDPITPADIIRAEMAAGPRLRPFNVELIKRQLLDVPHFCVYKPRYPDSSFFDPPPPIQALPTGPEHATCQYMLDTVSIEESTQDGNRKVLEEWFRQMKVDGDKATNERNENRLFVWIGDQLTTIRIRFLKKDRAFDNNFVQRFEQVLEIFGWFHAQLAQEFSLHKQYFGTSTSFGFKHAFENMGRKGLDRTATQGNFHYGFRQGLKHTAAARFRDLWCKVAQVDNIEELVNREPEELEALAKKILDEYASTEALNKLRSMPPAERDEELERSVQFCRDLLDYLILDDAMKTGDVGRMELLLPRLFLRFHGGGNHNYSHETLELMQALWKEWPVELKYVFRFPATIATHNDYYPSIGPLSCEWHGSRIQQGIRKVSWPLIWFKSTTCAISR